MERQSFSNIRYWLSYAIVANSLLLITGCDSLNGQKLTVSEGPAPTSTHNPNPTATPLPTPTPTVTVTPTPSPTPTPTSTPPSDVYTGPAEVEKFVMKFIDDGKAQGVDVLPDMKGPKLTIQFATLSQYGSSVIGLCESGTTTRRVTFSPTFWNSVDDTQRELLTHHELGHCVLYRDHRSSVLSSGAYASIMYPIIMSNSMYKGNMAYYLQELFTYGSSLRTQDFAPEGETEPKIHICDETDLIKAGS